MAEKPEKRAEEINCRILVPRYVAMAMFNLDQAIDLAMLRTLKTNNEVLFFYEPETKRLVSAIVEGECTGITAPLPPKEFAEQYGTFHTHSNPEPLIQQEIARAKEERKKLPEAERQYLEQFMEENMKRKNRDGTTKGDGEVIKETE